MWVQLYVGSHVLCVERTMQILGAAAAATTRRSARMQIRGRGFLYKMARHIVGAVVAVGQKAIEPSVLASFLQLGMPEALRNGEHRGWTVAEARGLHKVHVEYPAWTSADECLYQEDGVTLRYANSQQGHGSSIGGS